MNGLTRGSVQKKNMKSQFLKNNLNRLCFHYDKDSIPSFLRFFQPSPDPLTSSPASILKYVHQFEFA